MEVLFLRQTWVVFQTFRYYTTLVSSFQVYKSDFAAHTLILVASYWLYLQYHYL